jgi:Uncharacterised nucleotidyltransferase
LLYQATRHSPELVAADWRDALRSADMTSQVRHGSVVETAIDVLDTCYALCVRPTLLKGISISDQHYPVAHVRPMGDVDILVSKTEYERVQSALLQRGYTQPPDSRRPDGSHHGPPLFHPKHSVWIELHTGLFRETAALRRNYSFSPAHIAGESVVSTFHGRSVLRLTDDLQLAYIASYWLKDLSVYKIGPSFVMPLLDAIYLLKASEKSIDWARSLGSLDNEMALASLYVLLSYLSRHALHHPPSHVMRHLAGHQRIVAKPELAVIHAILDRYLVGGRPFTRLFSDWHATIVMNALLRPGRHVAKLASLPWALMFPPGTEHRYSISYQGERIARLFKRRD